MQKNEIRLTSEEICDKVETEFRKRPDRGRSGRKACSMTLKELEEEKAKYPHKEQPTYVPDVNLLSKCLEDAKGENRTMAEFASQLKAEDGTMLVSPSTLSRLKNHPPKRPMKPELIQAILLNDASGYLSYCRLMRANGYERKTAESEEEANNPAMQKMLERQKKDENDWRTMKNIIIREVSNRRMSQKYEKNERDRGLARRTSRFGIYDYKDLIFRIVDDDLNYWGFNFLDMEYDERLKRALGDEADEEERKEVEERLRTSCLRSLMGGGGEALFLRDVWEPDTLDRTKTSIVVRDPGTFRVLKETLLQKKYHSWISLILVDVSKEQIEEEFPLPREDGMELALIFSEPVRSGEEDDIDFVGFMENDES